MTKKHYTEKKYSNTEIVVYYIAELNLTFVNALRVKLRYVWHTRHIQWSKIINLVVVRQECGRDGA